MACLKSTGFIETHISFMVFLIIVQQYGTRDRRWYTVHFLNTIEDIGLEDSDDIKEIEKFSN